MFHKLQIPNVTNKMAALMSPRISKAPAWIRYNPQSLSQGFHGITQQIVAFFLLHNEGMIFQNDATNMRDVQYRLAYKSFLTPD